MNTKSLLERLQVVLRAAAWPTTAEKVFANESVIISAAAPEAFYANYRSPLAIISPGGMQCDPDSHPRLISQEVTVRLVVTSADDGTGEGALVGHHRVTNTSRNAGLLEVESELMDSMNLMQNDEGVAILLRSSSAGKAAFDGGLYIVARDYNFTARITTI